MKVGIIGGTGYGGVELIRLLQQHPHATIKAIVSVSQHGRDLDEIYPHLTGVMKTRLDREFSEPLLEELDLIFFATPSGVSKDLLPSFLERGIRCIDLSGDFRLKSGAVYEEWYKHPPAEPAYLEEAVYGLSEINADKIKGARLVANPGCYATAALLALIPVLKEGWIAPDSIIIDGKSGVSGAGRSPSLGTHYSEVNENVKAYKLGVHQHIPEMEQALGEICGQPLKLSFTTHLIPMTRGIMCTIYASLLSSRTAAEAIELYQSFYESHPFIRVRPEGVWPSTKEVTGSNYCDLGFAVDQRTGRLIIISVIDNLVKGAAGQAVQNMNLMCGWDVRSGLAASPVYP